MHRYFNRMMVLVMLILFHMPESASADPIIFPATIFAGEPIYQNPQVNQDDHGVIDVSGALVTSPCTLLTSEVVFSDKKSDSIKRAKDIYFFLAGCGDGVSVLHPSSSLNSQEIATVTLFYHNNDKQYVIGNFITHLFNGGNKLIYNVDAQQWLSLMSVKSDPLLSLRLSYE
ncbi:pilus-assembly fibrillin subunit [Edwardsiella tarda]|uniref:pilus-assembly fibrillin subunit n=1 Tax=Edwardsiella tarda TaxID=636 RepID=UPI00351C4EE8